MVLLYNEVTKMQALDHHSDVKVIYKNVHLIRLPLCLLIYII
jgi:hypothetical protein